MPAYVQRLAIGLGLLLCLPDNLEYFKSETDFKSSTFPRHFVSNLPPFGLKRRHYGKLTLQYQNLIKILKKSWK